MTTLNDKIKNTQGYKNLKNKGYSDEKIAQMVVEWAKKQGKTEELKNVVNQDTQTTDINKPTNLNNNQQKNENNINNNNLYNTNNPNTNGPVKKAENKTENKPTKEALVFWYETNLQQREKRNQNIAEQYYNSWSKLDETKLANDIKMLSSNKNPEAIQNTVNDIKTRYEGLQKQNELNIKVKEYETMPIEQLSDNITNGTIDWEVYNQLIKNNPELIKKVKDYQYKQSQLEWINKIQNTSIKYDKTKSLDSQMSPKTTMEKMSDKMTQMFTTIFTNINKEAPDLVSMYEEKMNTPEIKQEQTKLTWLEKKINDIDTNIADTEDEIRAKYAWTWATEWYIRARINKDLRALQKTRQLKANEYQATSSNYQNMVNNAKQELDTVKQQYTIDQNELNDKIKKFQIFQWVYDNERQYQLAEQDRQDKWKMLYTNQDFQKQAEARAWDRTIQKYQIETWDIDSNNMLAKKKWVNNIVNWIVTNFTNIWIPFQRSNKQISNDIINWLAREWKEINSANVSNYIQNNLIKKIKDKPEYQDWVNRNSWMNLNNYIQYNYTDANWNKQSAFINPKTKEIRDPMNIYNPVNKTSEKAMNSKVGDYWGQCWAFANNLTWLKGTPWGNSLSARIKKYTDKQPKVWWQVLFTWWAYDKTYWHIATVKSINDDWTITVVESNLKWDWKISTRDVKINDPYIKGYYNNTPLAQWKWATKGQKDKLWYVLSRSSDYIKYNTWKLTSSDKIFFNKEYKWWYNKFTEDAYNYWRKISLDELPKIDTAIKDLTKLSQVEWNIWDKWQYLSWIWDIAALINKYKSQQVLDNLISVKKQGATFWALSDAEGAILRKATSLWSINVTISPEQYHKFVNEALEQQKVLKNAIIKDNPYYKPEAKTWSYNSFSDALNHFYDLIIWNGNVSNKKVNTVLNKF